MKAEAFAGLGIGRGERVAIYLEKRPETVVSIFAAVGAGAVFVPVNPLLRAPQVRHILKDCNVRILVTSRGRLDALTEVLGDCPDLRCIIVVDGYTGAGADGIQQVAWNELQTDHSIRPHRVIDADMAAIIYTSGSTGLPKGVVLSHRNIVAGARSVASYLENTPEDRILSVLPLSFDAGLSQMTTAFHSGAELVLMNFLMPRDVATMAAKYRITGIAGVPPLWHQLAGLDWPEEAQASVRYFTNTGGHMPLPLLNRLRAALPNAAPFLMYGLTEAFRSTYLPHPKSTGDRIRSERRYRTPRFLWSTKTANRVRLASLESWCTGARWSLWATGTIRNGRPGGSGLRQDRTRRCRSQSWRSGPVIQCGGTRRGSSTSLDAQTR